MCQLLGVSAAQPIELNPWLRTLFSHSTEHPHGWGLAVFRGGQVNIEKEPLTAWQSGYLESRLKRPVRAAAAIAHIRRASVGFMAYENCHPFSARDISGRTWTLAHNGTLFLPNGTERFRKLQEGDTDSERALLYLVSSINEAIELAQGQLSPLERFRTAERAVRELAPENPLTLLFYDGELLYAHSNQPGHLCTRREGDAVLFATVPMDEETWEPVEQRRLFAYCAGELIFRGEEHPYEYLLPESKAQHMDYSQL